MYRSRVHSPQNSVENLPKKTKNGQYSKRDLLHSKTQGPKNVQYSHWDGKNSKREGYPKIVDYLHRQRKNSIKEGSLICVIFL